jgi:hypothetical protein
MPKYTVILDYTVSTSVEIEADSEEEALAIAEEEHSDFALAGPEEFSYLSSVGILHDGDGDEADAVDMIPCALPNVVG